MSMVYVAKQFHAFDQGVDLLGFSLVEDSLKPKLREYVLRAWYRHSNPIPVVDTDMDWQSLKELHYKQEYPESEIRVSKDGDLIVWGCYRWQITGYLLDRTF